MTNNFSTLKNSLESKKFYLLRMNPARSIMNDLTLVSGTTYTHSFISEALSDIKVNGVSYAKVTGTPAASEYSFDESTKLITITLHDTLANIQASGNIVAFYYLFYSDEHGIYANEDPEDSNTTMRFWEPRINEKPSFEETQSDIVDGFLSIGNTSVTLINDDNDFQRYLTTNDSFSRKQVKIWQCLDDVASIQKYFLGFSVDIKLSSGVVNISFDNAFSAFNDNLYSGSSSLASIFNATDYPDVISDSLDNPIYKIYSLSSKTSDARTVYTQPTSALSGPSFSLGEDCYKLTNISYNRINSTTNNRTWAACFASTANSDLSETAAGVVDVSADYGLLAGTAFKVTVADSSYYNTGDNVIINSVTGTQRYVLDIFSTTQIILYAPGSSLANGHTMLRPKISVVQIWDNDDDTKVYTLRYGRDYTTSTGADGVYRITFVNNFEANFAGENITTGLWADAVIGYRAYNHDDLSHGTVLQEIVEKVGLVVDAATIATANATSIKTNFSVPYFDQTSFEDANVYLQDLLTSTFGMVYLNGDFEVGYRLFDSISSTDEITEDEIIEGTLSQTIDYKDIITSLKFENAHGSKLPGDSYISIDTRYSTPVESKAALYLHETQKQKTINFITQDMDDAKVRIEKVLTNRRATLEFSTKGVNFDTLLGDCFNISSGDIIGGVSSILVQAMTIRKRADETTLSTIDFYNL